MISTTDSVQHDRSALISELAETIMRDLPGWIEDRANEGYPAAKIATAGGMKYNRLRSITYYGTKPKLEDAIALAKGWFIINAECASAGSAESLEPGIKEVEATPQWLIESRYRTTLDEYTRQYNKLQDPRRVPDSEWFKGASLCLKR